MTHAVTVDFTVCVVEAALRKAFLQKVATRHNKKNRGFPIQAIFEIGVIAETPAAVVDMIGVGQMREDG